MGRTSGRPALAVGAGVRRRAALRKGAVHSLGVVKAAGCILALSLCCGEGMSKDRTAAKGLGQPHNREPQPQPQPHIASGSIRSPSYHTTQQVSQESCMETCRGATVHRWVVGELAPKRQQCPTKQPPLEDPPNLVHPTPCTPRPHEAGPCIASQLYIVELDMLLRWWQGQAPHPSRCGPCSVAAVASQAPTHQLHDARTQRQTHWSGLTPTWAIPGKPQSC